MKKAALLWLLAGLGCGLANAADSDTVQITDGQRYYEKICAKCHETGIGPVLKERGWTAETYVSFARIGVKAMPAFRITDIDDATLLQVGQYLANAPATKP